MPRVWRDPGTVVPSLLIKALEGIALCWADTGKVRSRDTETLASPGNRSHPQLLLYAAWALHSLNQPV